MLYFLGFKVENKEKGGSVRSRLRANATSLECELFVFVIIGYAAGSSVKINNACKLLRKFLTN